MSRPVSLRPGALEDLIGLYDYIAEQAGAGVAGEYVSRLEDACRALRDFPERGTRRDDIAPGLRTLGFERRALIAFRVLDHEVEIVAVLYGGRMLTEELTARD